MDWIWIDFALLNTFANCDFYSLFVDFYFGKSVLDINDITYYILPIDCLLIALDAHVFNHNGYGHRGQSIG